MSIRICVIMKEKIFVLFKREIAMHTQFFLMGKYHENKGQNE